MNRASVTVMSLVVVLAFSPSVFAGQLDCVATDPTGDAFWNLSGSTPIPAQGYHDIAQIEVTRHSGVFNFFMNVAEAVPDIPTFLFDGVKLMSWFWVLDTDPATVPAGFPEAPGIAHPGEFDLEVFWNGESFSAALIDRRPLLNGGQAVVTPIAFSISKATLSVSVDAMALGDPSSFGLRGVTGDWMAPLGSDAETPIDLTQVTQCPAL